MDTYIDEESVKLALFSTGSETIRLKLEEQLGENIKDFKPIMREVPIPWDKKHYNGIPVNILYRTGRTIYHLDALYYGKINSTPTLFPIEFKLSKNITRDAVNQIIIYTVGLPVLFKSDKIGYPAKIFKNYIEIALSYRGIDLEEMKGKIRIQPMIIQIGGNSIRMASSSDIRYGKTIRNLRTRIFDVIYSDKERQKIKYYSYVSEELEEFLEQNIVHESLSEIPIIRLGWKDATPHVIEYSRRRRDVLCKKFSEYKELQKALNDLPLTSIPLYVSVRRGKTVIKATGLREREVEPPSANIVLPVMICEEMPFNRLWNTLQNNSGSEVILQVFLNGPSNPSFYFSINENNDEYVALEHARSSAYTLTFAGCFNRVVAYDAVPLADLTIIDDIIAPYIGKYRVERVGNTNILKIKLNMKPLIGSSGSHYMEFYMLAPKINKQAYSHKILPYMGRIDPWKILQEISEKSTSTGPIWRYYDILIIPIKYVNTNP